MKRNMCAICGGRNIQRKERRGYTYRESGLTNVVLMNGVYETTCRDCTEKTISVSQEWQLLQVVALALLKKPAKLSGAEMRFLRGACELTQAELAKRLRVRRETIAEREAKNSPGLKPGEELMLRVMLLNAFQDLLRSGDDHLTASHKQELRQFSRSLAHFAENLFVQAHPRIILRQREERWAPEPHFGKAA